MSLVRSILAAAVCTVAMANASAAGYFNATTKYDYEGWACNPSLPQFSGWIHFWRDDGKFLGALHAGIQREPAVGEICGDSGVHGFSGKLSIPVEYLDNQRHTVRAYFINPDNTNFELQNTASVVFDGGPQPYVFNVQPSGPCETTSGFWSLSGWVLKENTSGGPTYCPASMAYQTTSYFVYLGDPNVPVATEIDICGTPANASRIPAGWQTIRVKSDYKCITRIQAVQVGSNPPNFTFTYADTWTVRKTQ